MKTKLRLGTIAFALSAFAAEAQADDHEVKANQLFGAVGDASGESASPVGSYAKGCLAGGIQLPESGPTWQAMRLSRNRNWGHPILIDYIKELSAKVAEAGWMGLYIGDLSQPRGGPMPSGHQSHQIGLDVDIWMLPPESLNLTRKEREELSSITIRNQDQSDISENWTSSHMQVLKFAAEDPRVDRIFVAAAAKVEMCEKAGEDREWLQKIRPYYGHNYHFHVRLKCPSDSANCVTQTPTVSDLSKGGDGCDDTLSWWVTDYVEFLKKPPDPDAEPPPRKRGARDYTMADLPAQCQSVLDSG